VLIDSDEDWGTGTSGGNADNGARLEFEAGWKPNLLTFVDAPEGAFTCEEPEAGKELERTEWKGTAITAATIMKTPKRRILLRRVKAYWEVFPVLISFSPYCSQLLGRHWRYCLHVPGGYYEKIQQQCIEPCIS